MDKEFELVVEHVPSPDAEERLRRVFDILLRPISNGEEEHLAESNELHLTPDHPCDVARNLPTSSLVTTAKNELT